MLRGQLKENNDNANINQLTEGALINGKKIGIM